MRRRGRGDRRPASRGPARGRRAREGLAGRSARTDRAGPSPRAGGRGERRGVTAILVAAAAGLATTLLGTPFAIRLFRAWGWGQRIREDGPQGHLEKMGTPTMGGTVIMCGV